MTGIDIRLATPDDLTVVYAVMRAAFAPSSAQEHPSSALVETIDDLRAAIDTGGAVLASVDGILAGSGRFTVDRTTRSLSYERLSVLPGLQGRGVGTAMIEWLEQHARSLGLEEVRVCARSEQPDNRPYYLAQGYEITGYSERYGIPDIRTHLRKAL